MFKNNNDAALFRIFRRLDRDTGLLYITPVMTDVNKTHVPVLANETVELLLAVKGGIFFDGTVGLGGHSTAILQSSDNNFLYGTDKDGETLARARNILEIYSKRFHFFKTDFRTIETLPLKIDRIDGFLFDLGVSSFQLDTLRRGFSYAKPAPLDMRMDNEQKITACHVLNHYNYHELCDIFTKYGEIQNPAKIVDQVIFHRRTKKIERTDDLKTIIRRIYPQQKTMDPLSRIFQALRIEVNQELSGLEDFFLKLFHKMKPGARIVIISFHSLEDRAVKFALKKGQERNLIKILTKKPLTAGQNERLSNPRSRSAKLRAGEKILVANGR